MPPPDLYERLAQRTGAYAARAHLEAQRKTDAAVSEFRGRMLALEVEATRLHGELRERLAGLRDGADGERGAPGERGLEGPTGRDGKDGLSGRDGLNGERGVDGRDGQPGPAGRDGLPGERGERGPPGDAGPAGELGPAGRDGIPGERGPPGERGEAGPSGERGGEGLPGPPGEPGQDGARGERGLAGERGADGAQGRDGFGFAVRGTWSVDEAYAAGEVVALNGGSFVALSDAPGPCPGPGWQLWARQGKPGRDGLQGERGAPGATVRIAGGGIDPDGLQLSLVHDDGEVVKIDLYPLAEAIRALV